MMVWISIVWNSDGNIDCEILDSEPTESFRDELWEGIRENRISRFQIRCGYINGGDSSLEYASEG